MSSPLQLLDRNFLPLLLIIYLSLTVTFSHSFDYIHKRGVGGLLIHSLIFFILYTRSCLMSSMKDAGTTTRWNGLD